jgi:putative transcriptional regulator
MQINRLFEMLHMMLNKKNITAKELSEYFEVSVRTVYRDIETLASAGIPVYSLRGKNGGIRLLEGYTLNKSLISQDEQNEIMYALQSLKAANYPESEETLKKLSLIFNKSSDNWIEVDFSRYGSDDNVLFENIKQAILKKLIIRFTYFNSRGEKSYRAADPLKILFKEKAWYLFAYCHNKKDIRQFKINRIKELILTEEHFDKSMEDFEINDEKEAVKRVKVIVEIDKSQAYRVYDEFSEENINKMKDGNFEVIMENPESEWVYGYLLSFGEYLKVKEPERIKKNLFEKIEKMRENYK